MYIQVEKSGETRMVKERYLKNFVDQGWKPVKATKTKPAVKVEATAEVKPVPADWDPMVEEWAESEESISNNKGEA